MFLMYLHSCFASASLRLGFSFSFRYFRFECCQRGGQVAHLRQINFSTSCQGLHFLKIPFGNRILYRSSIRGNCSSASCALHDFVSQLYEVLLECGPSLISSCCISL